MIHWIDAFGFAAFVSNVWGNWLLAQKSRRGWVVRIVSIVLWGAYGSTLANVPMILNAATFFAINCYGWWKWRTPEMPSSAPEGTPS